MSATCRLIQVTGGLVLPVHLKTQHLLQQIRLNYSHK
jgi:hypothetical protein